MTTHEGNDNRNRKPKSPKEKMLITGAGVLATALLVTGCASNNSGNAAPESTVSATSPASPTETRPTQPTQPEKAPLDIENIGAIEITPDSVESFARQLEAVDLKDGRGGILPTVIGLRGSGVQGEPSVTIDSPDQFTITREQDNLDITLTEINTHEIVYSKQDSLYDSTLYDQTVTAEKDPTNLTPNASEASTGPTSVTIISTNNDLGRDLLDNDGFTELQTIIEQMNAYVGEHTNQVGETVKPSNSVNLVLADAVQNSPVKWSSQDHPAHFIIQHNGTTIGFEIANRARYRDSSELDTPEVTNMTPAQITEMAAKYGIETNFDNASAYPDDQKELFENLKGAMADLGLTKSK